MAAGRFGAALAALVVAGAVSACSSTPPPADPAGAAAAGSDRAAASTSPSVKAKAKRAAKSAEQRADARGPAGDRSSTSDRTGSAAGSTGGAGGTSAPAVSCMSDRTGDQDRAGSPPAYSDVVRACVREVRSSIRFEFTVGGGLPGRMSDSRTVLTLGFTLPRDGGQSSVQAVAGTDGWSAYLTHGQGRKAVSGLTVDGSRLYITVPAREFGATLRWRADSSWTKSQLLSTSYAFDVAPDMGTATLHRG